MNKQLQQLADDLVEKFGLAHYQLETAACHIETNFSGETHYICDLEFFPNETKNQIEDYNPPGTAIISYNITTEKLVSILFVNGQSFSTKTIFHKQSVKEVAKWIEEETGYRYGDDFTAFDTLDNGYLFKAEINGYDSTPDGFIEVEFDDVGKLTSFRISNEKVFTVNQQPETFTRTIEDVIPMMKDFVKLEQFPDEEQQRFVSVYTAEEIYVTNEGKRIIPSEHRLAVNHLMTWESALRGTIERIPIVPYPVIPIEEAFTIKKPKPAPKLTEVDVQKAIPVVTDVLRTVLPDDSGKWTLTTIEKEQGFIKAVCRFNESKEIYFERQFIVLLDHQSFKVLNYLDNGELFEIFDAFTLAPTEKISKEEAFQILKQSFFLTPTYVYDAETKQFLLCAAVHANDYVDAVSGELISPL